MRTPTTSSVLVGFIVSLATGPAALQAQIEYRTNQGNANTAGYALDKSNQLGTGGFNLSRPGWQAGAYSNAVITGNVSGLGAFQGFSPIPQENAFRGELPSASLSNFNRRSISPAEVSGGGSWAQPSFFYDQERTIGSLNQIRNRQTMPGTNRLSSPSFAPLNPATAGQRRFGPIVRSPVDQRLDLGVRPSETTTFGMTQTQTAKQIDNRISGDVSPAYRAAMGSSMFGLNLPGLTPVSTDEQMELPALDGDGIAPDGGLTPPAPTAPVTTGRPGEMPADPMAPGLSSTGIGSGTGRKSDFGVTQTLVDKSVAPAPLPLDGRQPENLGADRYADLYNAVRAAEQLGVRDLSFTSTPAKPAEGGVTAPAAPGAAPDDGGAAAEGDRLMGLQRRSSEGLRQLSAAAKWAGDLLEDPVTTFVGRYQDRLNEFMALGEEAMRSGQYYRAARQFDLAHTMDRRNPLPLLQRGHALLAAGDYVSALLSLEQGIRLFPQIAAFRLDLVALVGGKDVFDVRRADLEAKLAAKDNAEFRFLLGYIEVYSGLVDLGLKNLAAAAGTPSANATMRQFVDCLLGKAAFPELSRE